ncbi:MAG TPA: isochorismate synthase [Streptosporangiaceae bacterium]|nr:isochorismate synthase [Streptosporangiaceae bacterium]
MAVLSRKDPARLFVRSVAIPDPGELLGQLPQPDAVAWIHHGAGLVGWGEAIRAALPAGEDRFAAGEKWLPSLFDAVDIDDQVRVRGSGPVAFGTFTFDASSEGSALIVPRVLLGRDGHGRAWLTTVTESREPDLAALGWPAVPEAVLAWPPANVRWHDGSLPGPQWEHAVEEAVTAIKAGTLRKVVLAQDLFATANDPIDVRVLLRRLASRYPECFTFACDGMVGATPELLIRQNGRQVSALVLAGTTPRGGDPAEDEALGTELLASAKNTEEHAYAVASMRDALAPLCDALDVEARPALLKLPNLQHLGTWVRGTLALNSEPRSALGLAAAVHPTAAVCGTPTGTALELIRELEHMDRERYAGPVGWVDAEGNGEWGIALRCAQLSGRTARLFAGCGIVAGSDPAAELAEAQVKFRPMRGALDG